MKGFRWKSAIASLLAWYAEHRRDLPWRRTRDPYAIWVSEVMLQQTRVETVLPYYDRFLARFPDLDSLASADLEEVLKLWEGLGYYRRAGALMRAARWLRERGGWPRTAEGLLEMPGVGRYTAGAVASIAFGEPSPVLDGNIRRVWARVFALEETRSARATETLWALSRRAVALGDASRVNQALMELGATLCAPRAPRCPECPLEDLCLSAKDGLARLRPSAPRSRALPSYEVAVGLLWHRGRFFVQRRPEGGLLGGLWELPGGKLRPGESPREAVVRELGEEVGRAVRAAGSLPAVRHAYSHFKVRLHPFHCELEEGQRAPRPSATRRWLAPDEVGALPFPAATLRIFALAFGTEEERFRAAEPGAVYRRAD